MLSIRCPSFFFTFSFETRKKLEIYRIDENPRCVHCARFVGPIFKSDSIYSINHSTIILNWRKKKKRILLTLFDMIFHFFFFLIIYDTYASKAAREKTDQIRLNLRQRFLNNRFSSDYDNTNIYTVLKHGMAVSSLFLLCSI